MVVGGKVAQEYPEMIAILRFQLNALVQVRHLKVLGNKMTYSARLFPGSWRI